MLYDDGHYLWPPRPEKAIQKHFLNFYQNEGWIAQFKLNGTCSVIFVAPDRTVTAMTRHNDQHKMWSPSKHTSAPFMNLPGDGWYVFVAELMNNKIPGIKDTNYIHDILVDNGNMLTGTTFGFRQNLLKSLFDDMIQEEQVSHYVLDNHTWLAKNYTLDFSNLFESLDKPEYEGLVLKNPKGILSHCYKPTDNSGWQVKVRHPSKNYGF